MTPGRVPVGRGAFLLLALGAAALPPGAQLAFAAAAIAVLGLPHGAGDLAAVTPARRPGFLLSYGVVVALVLIVWLVAPATGLCLLLVCSAAHFALDDRASGVTPAAVATGLCLVAAPAAIHRDQVAALFADVTGSAGMAQALAALLQPIGLVALAVAVGSALGDRTRSPLARGGRVAVLGATAVLPPLVGFATGFVLLHAWRQTDVRRQELGCESLAAYLRLVAPVMGGAVVVLFVIALVFAGRPSGDVVALFAAIAALAAPHMIVTPLWTTGPERVGRWRYRRAPDQPRAVRNAARPASRSAMRSSASSSPIWRRTSGPA